MPNDEHTNKTPDHQTNRNLASGQISMFEMLETCFPGAIPFFDSTAASSPDRDDIDPARDDINPFLALVPVTYHGAVGNLFYSTLRMGARTPQEIVAGVRRSIQENLCQPDHKPEYHAALSHALEGLDLETTGALQFAVTVLEREAESPDQRARRKAAAAKAYGTVNRKEVNGRG